MIFLLTPGFLCKYTGSSVTAIDLSVNSIRSEGAAALARQLRRNQSVAFVNLSHNEAGDQGLLSIAATVATCENGARDGCSNLHTLAMKQNHIGASLAGVIVLSDKLRASSCTLTALDLTHNNIRDDGAKTIADAMQVNSTLITLLLSANNIGSAGANGLAKAINSNKHASAMRRLDLDDNCIRDDGAKVRGIICNNMYMYSFIFIYVFICQALLKLMLSDLLLTVSISGNDKTCSAALIDRVRKRAARKALVRPLAEALGQTTPPPTTATSTVTVAQRALLPSPSHVLAFSNFEGSDVGEGGIWLGRRLKEDFGCLVSLCL